MSKHTPGPWTADLTDHPETGDPTWAVDAENFSVCLVDGPSDAPNRANAHLIAAAPDLLDALKRVWEFEEGATWPEPRQAIKRQLRTVVEAAITKAEGQQ